jgi:hypothetical protein
MDNGFVDVRILDRIQDKRSQASRSQDRGG